MCVLCFLNERGKAFELYTPKSTSFDPYHTSTPVEFRFLAPFHSLITRIDRLLNPQLSHHYTHSLGNIVFESGFLESGETHSQADSADAAEISLSPALMQFEELSNSSSTFAAQLGAEGSTTASIADDSAMTDGPGVLIDSCTYDEDDSDFELDDLDDLMRGVQQAADHVSFEIPA
jgi:hypothetical protein